MAIFLPCIFPQCEDSQSLDTKLKLMSDIKLEMEALMGEIKTKIHNTIHQQHSLVTNIVFIRILKQPTTCLSWVAGWMMVMVVTIAVIWCLGRVYGKYPIIL